jgi:cadmium resistance protein CadD (predicted permease)
MIETILSSVVVFLATSVDELIVLTTVFAYAEQRNAVGQVYAGQLTGQVVLLTISVLAASGIEAVSQRGIGLLGIVPIVLGIRVRNCSEPGRSATTGLTVGWLLV